MEGEKVEQSQGIGSVVGRNAVQLHKRGQGRPVEVVSFKQRFEGGEGVKPSRFQGKSVPSRRKSIGPTVGLCQLCSRNCGQTDSERGKRGV